MESRSPKSNSPELLCLSWLLTTFMMMRSKTYEPGHDKMCLMSYANNKAADQPAHPRSLISAFVVRGLDSIISLGSIAEISRLYLASVAAQAGLCLAWSETPEDTFSRGAAHINGLWKPEAQNRTRPSFYACPGYQQLWWWFDQKWIS